MYEYFREGEGNSITQIIEQEYFINPRNNLNKINIYVWNKGKKLFTIEDYEISVKEYLPYDK